MSTTPLTVIATLRARPGKETALREALQALVAPTRQEPGCLNYDLHQALEDPGSFLFYENWASRQHLDEHLARPHVQALLARSEELLTAPPHIQLWQKIA